jgi:hypothetical protein
MTEMGCATEVYGGAWVLEMGCAMGSIYSADPGVDRVHIISSHYTINYAVYHSHLWMSLALSETPCVFSQAGSVIQFHALPILLEPEPLLLSNAFGNAIRGAGMCR